MLYIWDEISSVTETFAKWKLVWLCGPSSQLSILVIVSKR